MIQKRVQFRNSRNEVLHGELRIPGDEDEKKKYPAIIMCHNFRGNKDRELLVNLWLHLSYAEFAVLRFDFSGHGESEGTFKDFTVSRQVEDLKAAIDFIKGIKEADSSRIGLFGHSMGAVAVFFCAADSDYADSVASVFSLGAQSSLQSFIDSYMNSHQYREFLKKGYFQFSDFSEISRDFVDDMAHYNILEAVGKIRKPIFFFHPKDDNTVPFEHARELFSHAREGCRIEIAEGADHNFTDPAQREYLFGAVAKWFRETL